MRPKPMMIDCDRARISFGSGKGRDTVHSLGHGGVVLGEVLANVRDEGGSPRSMRFPGTLSGLILDVSNLDDDDVLRELLLVGASSDDDLRRIVNEAQSTS
jgi:hypothetical protein